MRFEWFVARRYLRSPHRPAVLRLVTLFSIIGVAAGVATLVIALAMNTGFRETLQDRLLGVTAHISLTRPGSGGIRDYESLAAKFSSLPGVRSVTPAVYQTMLMSFAGQSRGVVTKGIDPERERRRATHRKATRRGVETLAWRLRDADESSGSFDSIWTASPFATISHCRRFRFRLLRLRPELVFSHPGGRAKSFRRRGCG